MKKVMLITVMCLIFSNVTHAQTTDDECNWAVLKAAKTVLQMRDDFFPASAKAQSKKYFEELEQYVSKCEKKELTLTTYKSKLNRIADIKKELEFLKKRPS